MNSLRPMYAINKVSACGSAEGLSEVLYLLFLQALWTVTNDQERFVERTIRWGLHSEAEFPGRIEAIDWSLTASVELQSALNLLLLCDVSSKLNKL